MNVKTLSDHDLEQLRRAVQREQAARRRADTSPERIEEQIAEYQKAQGREDGDPWEQPVSALDAYPKGAVVEHEGQLWRSTTPANVWSPSVSGWRLEPETDEDGNEVPPPYVAPSGSHDAYQQGERITHNGQIWEAVRDGVVHSPDEYAPDWQLVEPEPEPDPEPPEDEEPETEEPEPEEPPEDEEPEDEEPEEPALPEWKVGVEYQPGDAFTYDGAVYSVQQAHTSAAHWRPDQVPALYERR